MFRLVFVVVQLSAVAVSASEPVRTFLDDLPTFWEGVEAADAIVSGTVITEGGALVLRVDETLKGAAPKTVECLGRTSEGAPVVGVLFKRSRFDAEVLRNNPSAGPALEAINRKRGELTIVHQIELATGERTRVVGLINDLLAAQRARAPRDEVMARRLFELDSTHALGRAWLEKTGIVHEATRQAVARRVLSRRDDCFQMADLLALIPGVRDPVLTDALVDALKATMARPRIAVYLERPLTVLASRVDPTLKPPTGPSGTATEEAVRQWFAEVDSKWQSIKATR